MSLTLFLALAILGCDFILYALFRWIYPDRGAKSARSPRYDEPAIDVYTMHRTPKPR